MTILKFVDKYGRLRRICCTHLEVFIYPENVGSSFLRNIGTYVLNTLSTQRHKTGLHTDHHVNFIFHEMQEPYCFKNIFLLQEHWSGILIYPTTSGYIKLYDV